MSYGSYIALGCLLSILAFRRLLRKPGQPPLPPGPRKLPLIKNLFDLPTQRQWLTFSKWAEEYNTDILHVEAAGYSMIILQSEEAIDELLQQRSAIYSSRALSRVISELVGWNWLMASMPYNELWKERRRLFQKYIHPSDNSLHGFHETEKLHIFLNRLLNEPQDFIAHIRHMISAISISMTYGIKVEPTHDFYVGLADYTLARVNEALNPGTFLAETFFFLRHVPDGFPGTGWKNKVKELRHEMLKFLNLPYDAALAAIADGTATDSFVSRCQQDFSEGRLTPPEQKLVKDTAGMFFVGMGDTVTSTITTFFLAIVCFPDAYRKAQEEVDRVLEGRLPDHGDMESMPYLNALLKEVLRWQPVMPLGFYHAVTCDDIYKGYHIPANSIVIPNVWALFHDPTEFPDPEIIRPERFLKDGKLHVSGRDPSPLAFGFGRRVCQGRHIAESIMLRVAASVLSLFDITKAVDDDGNVIEPTCEYTTGHSRQPVPFKCSIKPRSEAAIRLIRSL
ncbi:cytochrome P450 [Macrolepiota fuliginosa MF-IS2]|uniref:Cytochrome P450 n=1 Tax=Macrolepiota fuliginosa MF-IS2 TaxID=1400762 RepID=A0A9P5X5E4_9AGAR|nr:cytochrome P450 [Macrolepiota fuliginosa MF-IS2]